MARKMLFCLRKDRELRSDEIRSLHIGSDATLETQFEIRRGVDTKILQSIIRI